MTPRRPPRQAASHEGTGAHVATRGAGVLRPLAALHASMADSGGAGRALVVAARAPLPACHRK